MSKAVLMSIQPKWCELIASGKKTVEVRKTKPKLPVPFKVYIYCTRYEKGKLIWKKGNKFLGYKLTDVSGKVIGEFVCDCIISHCEMANADIAEQQGCIKREMLFEYSNGKELYGWHISDLVIYDKPKELSEFYVEGDCDCLNCKICAWVDRGNGHNVEDDCNLAYKGIAQHKSFKPITRPPQSWCYVEEKE